MLACMARIMDIGVAVPDIKDDFMNLDFSRAGNRNLMMERSFMMHKQGSEQDILIDGLRG